MRRIVPLGLAAALAFAAAAPGAHAAYRVGISDQQASTFSNPLYAPLKLSIARYITPYDVMGDRVQLAKLDPWLRGARLAKQRILVSFEHSRKKGKEAKLPSVAAYTKELRRFKKAYPFVKEISPWNEVNRRSFKLPGGGVEGQPTWNKPKRAAEYYVAARKVFRGSKIVALDILDENNVRPALKYIRTFRRYAKPAPKIWGLHNYSDTNRFSTQRTKAVLKATGSGELWLTETGGIVALGTSFPYDQNRAARALGCMFSLAKSNRRVKRLYIYHFNGEQRGARFDAGLVNPDNTKRPGYAVVQKRSATGC
jgi:hypothetical protein